jgi:dolichol-phosphate mannosyltransferase
LAQQLLLSSFPATLAPNFTAVGGDLIARDKAMSTLVVVPTFNEALNLPRLAAEILADPERSLLVVDDNSPDGTGQLADRLAVETGGRVAVLHRAGKQGLGSAYVAGFRYALATGVDRVVQMDADFSHDPADVAVGSRYVAGGGAENWPLLRRFVSRGGSLYTQIVLGLSVQDPTSGFKCFRRDALARIDLDGIRATGFGFQVEMNWRCRQLGLKVVEVPIWFVDRKLGESKMSSKIFFEAFWLVWSLRLGGPGRPKTPTMSAS